MYAAVRRNCYVPLLQLWMHSKTQYESFQRDSPNTAFNHDSWSQAGPAFFITFPPLATRLQSSPDISVYPHVVALYRMTEVSFVGHGFAGGPPNAAAQEKSGDACRFFVRHGQREMRHEPIELLR